MRFLLDREFRGACAPYDVERDHRSYWRRRAAAGVLVTGATWADAPGETLIVEVRDRAELAALLAGDPYSRAGFVTATRSRPLGEPVTVAERAASAGHSDKQRRPVRTISSCPDQLSPHEWRVARMMLDGLTNRQIAERLGVSQRGVEQHITRIYRKLAINRRAQLAVALRGQPGEPVPARRDALR